MSDFYSQSPQHSKTIGYYRLKKSYNLLFLSNQTNPFQSILIVSEDFQLNCISECSLLRNLQIFFGFPPLYKKIAELRLFFAEKLFSFSFL